MKIQELEFLLNAKNVPRNSYSLFGGLPNEALCISISPKGWEVYYSERGEKTDLTIFSDEHAACTAFLQQLLPSETHNKKADENGGQMKLNIT